MNFHDNRQVLSHTDDSLVWVSPLVWIITRIQDENYDERYIPELKEKINEYINNPEHTINDRYKKRTLLSWTAESEKLDIFKFLLDNGATDNWHKILEKSNNYYKKAIKTYKKETNQDKKRLIILLQKIQEMQEMQGLDPIEMDEEADEIGEADEMDEDAYTADAAVNDYDDRMDEDDDTVDEDDDTMDMLPNGQPPTVNDLMHDADIILDNRRKKDLLLIKQKELNDFIKEYVQKLEVRMLTIAAPHMQKTLPVDVIGEMAGFISDDKDMKKKAMKNYTRKMAANKSRKRKASPESPTRKKLKNNGGKKKINKKSNRKSKKNLKKASRKCRK